MTIKLPPNLDTQPGKAYSITQYQLTPSAIEILADEIDPKDFPHNWVGIVTSALDPEGVIWLASHILDGIACHRPTFVEFFAGLNGVHYKLV